MYETHVAKKNKKIPQKVIEHLVELRERHKVIDSIKLWLHLEARDHFGNPKCIAKDL